MIPIFKAITVSFEERLCIMSWGKEINKGCRQQGKREIEKNNSTVNKHVRKQSSFYRYF